MRRETGESGFRAPRRGLVSQISSLFAENIEKERGDSSKIESTFKVWECSTREFEGVRAVQSGLAVVTSAARSRENARRCSRTFPENATRLAHPWRYAAC